MVNDLGGVLWRARVEGRQVDRADLTLPGNAANAYAVQSAQITASELPVGGWKIGATNEKAQSIAGLEAPFIGPVLFKDIYQTGTDVPVFDAQDPGLESEFAVELGADLVSGDQPHSATEIQAAVRALRPSFEIVARRFTGSPKGAGPLLIADGGVNGGIVIGPRYTDIMNLELQSHGVNLTVSGQQPIAGSGAGSMWSHPIDAVAWLLTQPVVTPRGLRAGDIILTGTCTGLVPIRAGVEARCDFGSVGVVAARFVAASA